MSRQAKKRSNGQGAQQKRLAAQQEIVRLHEQVEQLERALRDVIAASDEVLVDLRASEQELAVAHASRTGFAAAWTKLDASAGGADEEFFEIGQVDLRSRRWLLTPR